jgi:AbrB family looped-hinge helix DNA binding protein
MPTLATTRMSSKGQVVIPEAIRQQLGLRSGTQFVVLAQRDVLILRAIAPPSMDEFSNLISAARKAARRTGMKKSDVEAATVRVRSRRRAGRSGK